MPGVSWGCRSSAAASRDNIPDVRARWLLVALLAGCSDYQQACSPDPFLGDGCASGYRCSVGVGETGVCVCEGRTKDLEIGQDCSDPAKCRGCRSSICSRATGRCVAERSIPDGGSCGSDEECVTDTICNRTLQRCEPPGTHGLGEGCGDTRECMAGLVCGSPEERTVCSTPRGVGEECERDWCAPGLICGAPLDPTRCQPLGEVGSLCTTPMHCRPGLTCNGWYDPRQCDTGQASTPCLDDRDCVAPLTCVDHGCG